MRWGLWMALALAVVLAACRHGEGGDPALVAPTEAPTPSPTVAPTPTPTPTPPPVASLADVFPPQELELARLDPSHLRVLVATGDVIPARMVDVTIRRRGDDFLYPVQDVAHLTRAADVTVINLEAPLIEDCPYHDTGFTFCGRPGFVRALEAMGVDVATLENNHIGNYGQAGIASTQQVLARAGIAWADRHRLAVLDVRGLRFGFLAFNGVGESFDREAVRQGIASARPQVDVLVVAFHWGMEYVDVPQPAPGIAPDDPVEIAHLAVDAGADLVLGNHPHWVQAVEVYRGKLIVYAHGNFIFDQMWSYETRVGVIGRYTFYDRQLVRAEFLPVLIEDYSRPRPLEGAEAQAVLERMRRASEALAQRLATRPSAP
ncbi:MAG TPA: CapA family protein [Dehalococcoidia bacterium]|nr:CapA family protein [Dehalococcoidia bacterium]